MTEQRSEAPAKINLTLDVLGRRPDGFHEIRSVVAPIALSDELSARVVADGPVPFPDAGADRVVARGLAVGPPEQNLVVRALDLLRVTHRRPLPCLEMQLVKRIPVAAGLGGGSSDAAAALELAARTWGVELGPVTLRRLAARLGSDVPFFTLRSWAVMSGRGEILSRVPPPTDGPLGVLLVTPDMRLASASVYDAYEGAAPGGAQERRRTASGRLAARLGRGMSAAELSEIVPANDLWPAAAGLLPGLAQLRATIAALVGRRVHLTGSGTTLYVLYPTPDAARRAGRLVRGAVEGSDRSHAGATRPVIIATHTLGGP